MQPEGLSAHDLAEKAARNIEAGLRTLIAIKRRPGKATRVRVAGGKDGVKSLWGELCAEVEGGKALVWLDSTTLLAWLVAYAGVEVEATAKDAPGMKVLLGVDGGRR